MTTSKELVETALRRETVDRIPFCAPQGSWALELSGVSLMDSINNPKLAASAQFKVVDECHMDAFDAMWDWLMPVEAMGCKVKIPEFGTIPTISHIVKDPSDLDKLELPDIRNFYRYKAAEETAGHISDVHGKDRFLVAGLLSPFTLAGELRGVDNMMVDCFMDEDFVHALVKESLEVLKAFTEEIVKWDVDAVTVCDPTASGDLVSAADFEKFSKGPMKDLGKIIKKSGKIFINHTCGDTSDRLAAVAETGCDAFSLDVAVDVGNAVKQVGDRMAIIGNIDPVGIIYSGTPDAVRKDTLKCLERGGKRGYVLGTGCDIPLGSSLENVRAISDVSMKF
ncbi:MAG: uroporphyrinogen decarboxylase family protein [Candidatus Methanoplasma sp.]|jgi:MtaA/CmuA family methyltransferase|nr:uroporphyrinogen decarboxylase family protein [Candidatus Methanoplasma sp.]